MRKRYGPVEIFKKKVVHYTCEGQSEYRYVRFKLRRLNIEFSYHRLTGERLMITWWRPKLQRHLTLINLLPSYSRRKSVSDRVLSFFYDKADRFAFPEDHCPGY